MSYKLVFDKRALKEWRKLSPQLAEQFKKKLAQRLEDPKVISDKLSGYKNRYKIKLRSAGYRLVYEVNDTEIIVLVLTIGKRERSNVYQKADER
ncbi:type II toxin-antitoxin system RelE family toxin [Pasteurella atlantica]|uniref:type II toxin-antitoxin system RelE family toxin n=1 Tax=Pasteurellaceae TaxID=712 RepID=UPI00276D31CB|nr:type II toxin-antitoxin system RelE/ParE family toxin [Pasteurella atlantica]MDP8098431.1 type II toxin-antitoxin system RelE/ParE family toxin [Pasteurella atlantica]MDP8106455.1 type II toxin-antitoxin system RelE/ParE family toxin [Pasteurella atlantica]MDP8116234.1 type II toxin-antitoxin system RelE/ParE family toxin [Pasteurella atlantica]